MRDIGQDLVHTELVSNSEFEIQKLKLGEITLTKITQPERGRARVSTQASAYLEGVLPFHRIKS